jgi:hypothetical protein
MIERFLCAADAKRLLETLERLSRHDISGWALAGGLAVEIHCVRAGLVHSVRPLNDIDFVAPGFDAVSATLARDFLFRHVHPLDPPGKTILQLVDARTALRADLFRACGATMARAVSVEFPFGKIPLIAAEDVVARLTRLLVDLRGGVPVPAKHADDYIRMQNVMQQADMEAAWRDHRESDHPATFREADQLVRGLIAFRHELLITPEYSTDATQFCSRCVALAAFPLADKRLVLSLLGYC